MTAHCSLLQTPVTALERKLLEKCLARLIPALATASSVNRIFLPISKDAGLPGLQGFIRMLEAPPETLLVPIRVAWLMPQNDGGAHKPLALRHLLFGDPRHPGNLRGRWILFRDPNRAECIAGEPATIADLKARYSAQLGSRARECDGRSLLPSWHARRGWRWKLRNGA